MADFNKKSGEVRDYKEHFEFCLTVGDIIICQRYFKINNFNPASLRSYDLVSAIRNCADIIDRDLKQKTQIYLETFAPRYFESVEEMERHFSDPYNASCMRYGEGIVVRNSEVDYFWGNNGPQVCTYKFDDGELNCGLTDEDVKTYKFAFLIDGEEVVATTWNGIYPKYVSKSIDLSNKRGKFDGEDLTRLSFEQYLLYKLVENRPDLVWGLIKEICSVCSYSDSIDYLTEGYGYENKFERVIAGVNDEATLKLKENRRKFNKQKEQTTKA